MKQPILPIWVVCSESHYSVLFSTDMCVATSSSAPSQPAFDLIYYDELARQEDDIILTVTPGTSQSSMGSEKKKVLGRKPKETIVPIDCVIRTRWAAANVCWNGRTVIL